MTLSLVVFLKRGKREFLPTWSLSSHVCPTVRWRILRFLILPKPFGLCVLEMFENSFIPTKFVWLATIWFSILLGTLKICWHFKKFNLVRVRRVVNWVLIVSSRKVTWFSDFSVLKVTFLKTIDWVRFLFGYFQRLFYDSFRKFDFLWAEVSFWWAQMCCV